MDSITPRCWRCGIETRELSWPGHYCRDCLRLLDRPWAENEVAHIPALADLEAAMRNGSIKTCDEVIAWGRRGLGPPNMPLGTLLAAWDDFNPSGHMKNHPCPLPNIPAASVSVDPPPFQRLSQRLGFWRPYMPLFHPSRDDERHQLTDLTATDSVRPDRTDGGAVDGIGIRPTRRGTVEQHSGLYAEGRIVAESAVVTAAEVASVRTEDPAQSGVSSRSSKQVGSPQRRPSEAKQWRLWRDHAPPNALDIFLRMMIRCGECKTYARWVIEAAQRSDSTAVAQPPTQLSIAVAGYGSMSTFERRRRKHFTETSHWWPPGADVWRAHHGLPTSATDQN
jgi:hypothetical protein